MSKSGTEKVYHPRGAVRYVKDAPLTAGAGTMTFDPVPQGYELRVQMIAAAATDVTAQPAGMVVSAYVDSASVPEALIGWDMIVSPAPGIVIEPYNEMTLRAGERIVLALSAAGAATTARARVSGVLVETEDRSWPRPDPVSIVAWADPQMVQPTVWSDQPAEG
jgi:hypothetical protein